MLLLFAVEQKWPSLASPAFQCMNYGPGWASWNLRTIWEGIHFHIACRLLWQNVWKEGHSNIWTSSDEAFLTHNHVRDSLFWVQMYEGTTLKLFVNFSWHILQVSFPLAGLRNKKTLIFRYFCMGTPPREAP